MEFVDEMEFDRLGVFAYSPEEGTPAEAFSGQVEEAVKQTRRECLPDNSRESVSSAALESDLTHPKDATATSLHTDPRRKASSGKRF